MLTLPIKKEWFDMIASGKKREEYRDNTPYYRSRFQTAGLLDVQGMPTKNIAVIVLRNGYSKASPSMTVLCSLSIGQGKREWGAEEGKDYFILHILQVTTKNCQNSWQNAISSTKIRWKRLEAGIYESCDGRFRIIEIGKSKEYEGHWDIHDLTSRTQTRCNTLVECKKEAERILQSEASESNVSGKKTYRCPRCGNRTLEIENRMDWDCLVNFYYPKCSICGFTTKTQYVSKEFLVSLAEDELLS